MEDVVIGKASTDGQPFRGWFIGAFVPPELGLRSTRDAEIKWQRHAHGEVRDEWGSNPSAASLSILVSGCIRLVFDNGRDAILQTPGDYALWAPGVGHRWRIEQDDTIVLTVRWPSVAA